MKSTNALANQCSKALTYIDEASSDPLVDPAELESLREAVTASHSEMELAAHIKEAEKHEFKGNRAKALNSYQDALWGLLNDDIDDSLQADKIESLKAKIDELKK
ncbi:hypothetical protein C4J81_01060 [Deltaproteobacteria bacterium Smac51]|nr:hypothetical protein C4J81_01060 [Deltaproteobacteria bacterium Smac51]